MKHNGQKEFVEKTNIIDMDKIKFKIQNFHTFSLSNCEDISINSSAFSSSFVEKEPWYKLTKG